MTIIDNKTNSQFQVMVEGKSPNYNIERKEGGKGWAKKNVFKIAFYCPFVILYVSKYTECVEWLP